MTPSIRPIALVRRHHEKDWQRVMELHVANVAQSDEVAQLRNGYAFNLTEKARLGERLALWANLIAAAAGLPPDRQPSDDEAETILLGWAVEEAFKRSGTGFSESGPDAGNVRRETGEGSRPGLGGEPGPDNPPTPIQDAVFSLAAWLTDTGPHPEYVSEWFTTIGDVALASENPPACHHREIAFKFIDGQAHAAEGHTTEDTEGLVAHELARHFIYCKDGVVA